MERLTFNNHHISVKHVICQIRPNDLICSNCIKICHTGHDLERQDYIGGSFCDYGVQGEAVCKALGNSRWSSRTFVGGSLGGFCGGSWGGFGGRSSGGFWGSS